MAKRITKLLSLFTVLFMVFTFCAAFVTPNAAESTEYLLGDVNGNGVIGAEDYLLIKRAYLGTATLDETEALCADVDGNGHIGTRDYALVKRHVIGTYTITGTVVIEPKGSVPAAYCPNPVDPSEIPAFSYDYPGTTKLDSQYGYVVINNNVPYFYTGDKTSESYEYYCARDSLGRCVYAVACIGQDIMPTSDRGNISSVKPTGWESNNSYSIVSGGSLYNRSHLIAFSLTGENANWENLITGTTYMNQTVMTTFETMVRNYILSTNNHVLYRVTPIFVGNNLVASGVMIEALSIEDNGAGICFNVYLYNAQPGITIDYSTGANTLASSGSGSGSDTSNDESDVSGEVTYIVNKNSKKFHLPTCSSVSTISEANKLLFYGTREEAIEEGYSPCGNCKP